jgi:hypothetical protein
MFVPLPMDQEGGNKGNKSNKTNQGEKEYAAPKDYFLYTLLAITLGIFGADKFYLGNNWQGIAKLFSVFNIFLFLFGLLWVVWDAVHAYFMTKSILKDGVAAPMPFSWFFSPTSADIFHVQEVKEAPKEESFWSRLPIPSLPVMPWKALYNELVVPVLQPTVGSAVNNASKVVSVGTKAIALGNTVLQSAPGFAADLGQQVGQQAIQEAERVGTSVDAVQAAAATAAAQRQTGGGSGPSGQTSGPGPILAGALTALLLAGGLKGFYDFLSKQVA